MYRTTVALVTFFVSLSAVAAEEIALPPLRSKTNPDALIFYEAALELTRQQTEDYARYRDAITEETRLRLELDRSRELAKVNSISDEELENAEADFKVAQADTQVAAAYLELRKHEIATTLLQERHHAGEVIGLDELKAAYEKRWLMRHGVAKVTKERAEAEVIRQDARMKRRRKLHRRATSTRELQQIKAERYRALHAVAAAEKQLQFYSKVSTVYSN